MSARYRIRRRRRVWTVSTPAGRVVLTTATWSDAIAGVDRRLARKRAALARTTQADYALARGKDH